jgi:Holliday junction DNA helicase RuvA
MFDFIRGTVTTRQPTHVVLDANGVGYYLEIPLSTYPDVPEVGTAVQLITHFHVTDSDQRLFGFATETERMVFRFLCTGVKNIGPAKALSILSSVAIPDFMRAIRDSDIGFLKKIKGVGPKTAERLVVELKDRVDRLGVTPGEELAGSDDGDAIAALESLGSARAAAETAVQRARKELGDDANLEDLIKTALQY